MKRQAVFLFLPIFLVFFVWGLQVGNSLEMKIPAKLTNQQLELEKNISSLPNGQKSLFIFIISSLDDQSPDLVGVWLMSYMSAEPYATVLAVYPYPNQGLEAGNNQLADKFQTKTVDGIAQLDEHFLGYLKEANIWFSGYILIDFEGVHELFNRSVGEGELAGYSDGDTLLDKALTTGDQSPTSLEYQTILLQQLCNKFTLANSISDLSFLRDLFPDHISSNLDPDVLLGDWKQFITSRNGSFCVFPQKELLLQVDR